MDQLQSLPNEITPSPENLGLLQRQAILESNLSSSGSAWFLTALLTLVVALPAAYRFAVISRGGTVQDRLTRVEDRLAEDLLKHQARIEGEIRELELMHVRDQFEEDVRFAEEAQELVRRRRRRVLSRIEGEDLAGVEEEAVMDEFLAVLQRVREIDFMRGVAWNEGSRGSALSAGLGFSNVRDIRSVVRKSVQRRCV